MYHQVPWNKNLLEKFAEYGELSEEEIKAMKLRCQDVPRYVIARELNVSEATVSRIINKLKKKYDYVCKQYPDIFPKRRFIRNYIIKYSDFSGTLSAEVENKNFEIMMENKEFDSLEEARQFIVKTIEDLSLEEFGLLDKIHMNISLDFELKIKPK